MKYEKKLLEKNKLELEVKFDKEEWEKEVDKAYVANKAKFKVQGFRNGSAPRKVIEANYGQAVFFNEALEEAYYSALDEVAVKENLFIVAQPTLAVKKMDETGLEVVITCELKPEVKLGKYTKLGVKKEEIKVSEVEVKAEIEIALDKAAKFVEVERAAKLGDTVNLDFCGKLDGVEFAGGKADAFDLVLGSKSFIDTFEDQLVGLKKGEEKDVEVTFPAEYGEKSLAGKPAVFSCKINEVREKVKPELNDEFVSESTEFENVEEFKASIKAKLEKEKTTNEKINFENRLFEAVSDNCEVEVGEGMISEEVEQLVRTFSERLRMQGMNLEDYLMYTNSNLEDYKKSLREVAGKNVKMRLIIEEIIKVEKITISDEEVKEHIVNLGEKNGKVFKDLEKIMKSEYKNQVASNLLMEKFMKYLVENN